MRMETLKILCCYAQEDRSLVGRFRAHLRRVLELEQVTIYYLYDLLPGVTWEIERDNRLREAHIILLLLSADFLGSDEHYKKEALPALERQHSGQARVIPIILRPVQWGGTDLGKLTPLPEDGRPVVDNSWPTKDHALFAIVDGIKHVIAEEKDHRFGKQERHDGRAHDPLDTGQTDQDASAQLAQLIHSFKALRAQIADFIRLKKLKGFSRENWESQYNKLYGDALVFVATYLPESATNGDEGFVERVYKKTREQLQKRADPYVTFTRLVLSPLAKLEQLAEQIDACRATLEFYQQKYYPTSTQQASFSTSTQQASSPARPTKIRANHQPSRDGNKGTIIFDLHGRQHTLEYLRRDNLSHQIFLLTQEGQELVRLVEPAVTLKPLHDEVAFQIDGVDCLFTFKMRAVTSIMSVKIEVGGVEVFRT